MSPIRQSLVILAATLLSGPSLAWAAPPPSTTILVRNARQLHAIVDRDFRVSPLYPQLCQAAERIEQRAESIRNHLGHPASQTQIRQNLMELDAAVAHLDQLVAQLPARTVLQAHQASYQKNAAVQVTIGNGYIYQATPTYRPQAALNPRDIARLQNALADVDTAAADFGCALSAWERTILWDHGGWDRPRQAPVVPSAPWGLSDSRHPQWR